MSLGYGRIPTHSDIGSTNDMIRIPDEYVYANNDIESFVKWYCPNIPNDTDTSQEFMSTGILTVLITDVE